MACPSMGTLVLLYTHVVAMSESCRAVPLEGSGRGWSAGSREMGSGQQNTHL
jgi:hypothetical protein